jgi:hypothetical protein
VREVLRTIAIGVRVETKGRPSILVFAVGVAVVLAGVGIAFPTAGVLESGKGLWLLMMVISMPIWLPVALWFAGRAEIRRMTVCQAQERCKTLADASATRQE